MVGQDPSSPPPPLPPGGASTPVDSPGMKPGSWDWLWPCILAGIIFKLFGVVGGLISFGCFYWLRPMLGTWGALAASGALGVAVSVGLSAMLLA